MTCFHKRIIWSAGGTHAHVVRMNYSKHITHVEADPGVQKGGGGGGVAG